MGAYHCRVCDKEVSDEHILAKIIGEINDQIKETKIVEKKYGAEDGATFCRGIQFGLRVAQEIVNLHLKGLIKND